MDLESDTRFKTLIQPIRDLSLNWDIDIAEELNDYLEELDKLGISIDNNNNNKSSLNFAEAALLIQGSTAIYSKKVEYLHQLVLNALELVTSQKGNKSSNPTNIVKGKSNSASFLDDKRILFGNDTELILLDDILEEGSNIVLSEVSNSNKHQKLLKRHSLSGDLSKTSMILMYSILHEDHGSTNLRLSSCRMDRNGALLIGSEMFPELSDISMIAKQVNNNSFTTNSSIPMATDIENTDTNNELNDCYHYHDKDDNDGEYFPNEENFVPIESTIESKGLINKRDNLQNNIQSNHKSMKNIEKHIDIQLLDPHETVGGSKNLKKGNTFKLPSSLSNRKNDHEKNLINSLSKNKTTNWNITTNVLTGLIEGKIPLDEILNYEFLSFAPAMKKKSRIHKVSKQVNNGNHVDIVTSQYTYQNPYDAFEHVNNPVDNDNAPFWANDDDNDYDQDDENRIEGSSSLAAMRSNITSADVESALDAATNSIGQDISGNTKSGGYFSRPLAAVLEEEEELARRVEDALNDSLCQSNSNTYESLCRRHIEEFMKGAEQYARETQLSKRVSEWTYRLEHVLHQQEEATTFDIHSYADNLLTQMNRTCNTDLASRMNRRSKSMTGFNEKDLQSNIVRIDEVVGGLPAAEVSRIFLACLQLANSGNVEIISNKSAFVSEETTEIMCNKDSLEFFEIQLLSDKRPDEVHNIFSDESMDTITKEKEGKNKTKIGNQRKGLASNKDDRIQNFSKNNKNANKLLTVST